MKPSSHLAWLMAIAAACTGGDTLSSASYAITLDTSTGIGFVGKGAVQSAFGWNNAGLQSNAAGITFAYVVTSVYQQSCVHATGGRKVVEKTFQKTVELDEAVAFAARRNPQDKITGFNLTGITGTTGEEPPTDLCNPGRSEPDDLWAPDPNGAYPELTQTSTTPATLFVTYEGVSHPIWIEGQDDDDDDAAE